LPAPSQRRRALIVRAADPHGIPENAKIAVE